MSQRNRLFAVLAYGFVLLGMSVAVPGVVWPSVAETFDRNLADLGLVTLMFGGGYTISSALSGRMTARWGIGGVLTIGSLSAILALLGIWASAEWVMFLAAAGLLGFSGGLVDAATNTFVALRRGARAMGSIHAIFGVGAFAGPILVTALLQAGLTWRVAFLTLALVQVFYLAGLRIYSTRLDIRGGESASASHSRFWTPVAVWSLLVFLTYAGVGTGTGAWAFTFLTEERAVSTGAAGLVVGGYWGGLTLSRLLLGAFANRFHPDALLRWATLSTTAALVVLWLTDSIVLSSVALIFSGFAQGPVFPLEMLLTPKRVGEAHTSQLVGFEISAANVGGALLPGLMGVFVAMSGLTVIPALLVGFSLLLAGSVEMLRRESAKAAVVSV